MKSVARDAAAVIEVPAPFLEWQSSSRREVFDALQRGEVPGFCAAHLPVVSTLNQADMAFPVHSANKGVGLMPRPEYLERYTASIEDCLKRCAGKRVEESLAERIAIARALYDCPTEIDPGLFGTIEIFRGQTYKNLLRDPRAALLFTGTGPSYLSYQFNCAVEVVGPDHPSFRFILGMRLLFEGDGFHIRQPEYPMGYVFRTLEVFDKTPRVGKAGGRCPMHASAD